MSSKENNATKFHLGSILRQVWSMLTLQERRRAAFFLGVVLVNSFLEVLGLSAVLPVIAVAAEPTSVENSHFLSWAYHTSAHMGISSPREFLVLLAVLLFGIFLFKALVNLVVTFAVSRFSLNIGHRLSGEMWKHHFSSSLERMRSNETGRILEEINNWPPTFASTFIVGNMLALTELFVMCIIAVGLLAYQPFVMLSVGAVLASGSIAIRLFTKSRIARFSEIEKKKRPQANTLITNAIKGFLEVITFGASESIKRNYLTQTAELFRINSFMRVLNLMPAKLYEVLAISAVAGIVIVSTLFQSGNDQLFELMTVVVIAAYRLMPSLSRINNQLISMRRFKYTHEAIWRGPGSTSSTEALHHRAETPSGLTNGSGVNIHVQNLSLRFQGHTENVISNLTFSFQSGGIHAITGPSGSGKSTLINGILGLIPAWEGVIETTPCIHPSMESNRREFLIPWLTNVGYLSQKPFLFKGNVHENLTLGNPEIVIDNVLSTNLINKLGLSKQLGHEPFLYELAEGGDNLSGGQQQRLALLRALQVKRPVLILDEATSALDRAMRDVVFELLREQANDGATVILVTHDKELASKCDDVLDLG